MYTNQVQHLSQIVDKINRDQPVSLNTLVNLADMIMGIRSDDLMVNIVDRYRVSEGKYILNLSTELKGRIQSYLDLYDADYLSRTRPSYSFNKTGIILYKSSIKDFPKVLLTQAYGRSMAETDSLVFATSRLCLINDFELFSNLERFRSFLIEQCGLEIDNLVFAFVDSARCSASHYDDLLSMFNEVFFLFDLDLNSIVLAKSLLSDQRSYYFILPEGAEQGFDSVSEFLTKERHTKLTNIMNSRYQLKSVSGLLLKHRKELKLRYLLMNEVVL